MLVFLAMFIMQISKAQQSLTENFESFPNKVWAQGSTYSYWKNEYHGYGRVGVETEASSTKKVLYQKPMKSVSPDETHASLVLSKSNYKTPIITLRSKTVQQLRIPVPNPWETAWVVWDYTHDHRFYYFALKTNGWELGKVDDTKLNPTGPSCFWPSYKNCKYEGAQRYLATGGAPRDLLGKWNDIRVVQQANVLKVYVAGKLVVTFKDNEKPYLSGKVGFYNEDAYVRFDNVQIQTNVEPLYSQVPIN